uniref:Uncharacterized protein n=1 Tax=Oryza glumipatula TaxID=40148 RepID=A0A0E0AH54_9ORYZ
MWRCGCAVARLSLPHRSSSDGSGRRGSTVAGLPLLTNPTMKMMVASCPVADPKTLVSGVACPPLADDITHHLRKSFFVLLAWQNVILYIYGNCLVSTGQKFPVSRGDKLGRLQLATTPWN